MFYIYKNHFKLVMCYLTMNFPLILINLWKQDKEAYYIHLEFREEKKEKNGEKGRENINKKYVVSRFEYITCSNWRS